MRSHERHVRVDEDETQKHFEQELGTAIGMEGGLAIETNDTFLMPKAWICVTR